MTVVKRNKRAKPDPELPKLADSLLANYKKPEDQIIEWRGRPQAIRCDNGPEYISAVTAQWASKRGIRIDFIQPGQPQQDAYIERYNRTVRYDWLAHHLFESLDEIQEFATRWL